ncbi:hypothetical protein BDQ17DRAFT_1374607, partial [Cyathus striatus]
MGGNDAHGWWEQRGTTRLEGGNRGNDGERHVWSARTRGTTCMKGKNGMERYAWRAGTGGNGGE